MYDIQKIRRWLASPLLRRVLPLLLVVLCLAAMVVMLFFHFGMGLALWFLALFCGALLLFVRRRLEKKLRDLEEEEKEAEG